MALSPIIPNQPAGPSAPTVSNTQAPLTGGVTSGHFSSSGSNPNSGYTIVDVGSLISQTPTVTLNESTKTPREQQATVAGAGSIVPLVYGRRRLGPKIIGMFVGGGNLIIVALWCEGPIYGVETYTIDDLEPPPGVIATHYTGTATQVADPTLVTYYAALGITYGDPMPYTAYSVFEIPPGVTSGFPRINAIILGKLVRDNFDQPFDSMYHTSPAYCIADFIENDRYGMKSLVDWISVQEVAAIGGQLVGNGGAELRYELNIILDRAQSSTEWLQVLRDYASCWIVPEGPFYKLIPDAPADPVAHFDAEDMVEDSLQVNIKGNRNTPTVIEVVYMQTGALPWREDSETVYAPGVLDGSVPQRRSRINKNGLMTRSAAARYGNERLNEGLLNNRHVTVVLFDKGVTLNIGDIITISHPKGLDHYPMRINRVTPVSPGRWQVTGTGYAPDKYDDGGSPEIPPNQPGFPGTGTYTYTFLNTSLLTNMTQFYDWYMRRYWVTDMQGVGDTWDTFFPGIMNTYTDPLWDYHTPGESRLRTEVHDFGSVVVGTWRGTQTYFAVSGTVFPEKGASQDGTNFNHFVLEPATTTYGRHGRIQNYAFTTSTLYITRLGDMTVSVHSFTESGVVHTSATARAVVKFINKYLLIASFSATPIGNVSLTATVDRILVNPEVSGVMQYNNTVTDVGGFEQRVFLRMTYPYEVQAGDVLEYKVRIPNGVGAIQNLGGINAYNVGSTVDLEGAGCLDGNSELPMTWDSTAAQGVWVTREIDLTNVIGEFLEDFCVTDLSALIGEHIACYDAIKIKNGGSTIATLYASNSEPPEDEQKVAADSDKGAVGQANSMTVYLFDGSAAQVAGDAGWTITGAV